MSSSFTQQMQAMLPQWMKMAKDPNSVGAQFLSVFGMEFEEVQFYLDYQLKNQYIETADVEMIDIVYKVPVATAQLLDMNEQNEVVTVKGDQQVYFMTVNHLRHFYTADNFDSKAIFDRSEGFVYLRPEIENMDRYTPFDYIRINGTPHYEYFIHHVWNAFDEFGLFLGIDRLYGETNGEFKERILDVFRKPGNSTKEGLENALKRELNIDTLKIDELADYAFRESLLNADGSPSKRMLSYVNKVNQTLGFTWDRMNWGEAYWHSIEEDGLGFEYLPHVWDPSLENWKEDEIQSGIGDGDDLLVLPPKEESNIRNFNAYVGVVGTQKETELVAPEMSFKYKITAHGKVNNEEFLPETYKYTVSASQILKLNFIIRAFQQYHYTSTIDLDRTTTAGYELSSDAEIVSGTDVMSYPNHPYLRVRADLSTSDQTETSKLKELIIKYEDASGIEHQYVMSSQANFTQNDTIIQTTMQDVLVNQVGEIELGYGDFFYQIDTEGAFRRDTGNNERMNIEFGSDGSVSLKLPDLVEGEA